MSETATIPKVFISYSHDTPEHKKWVLALATRLADGGIDVALDQWDLGPGHDLTAYMNDAVAKADKVVLICSTRYVTKVNDGNGGAGYEGMIVHSELLRDTRTSKFIPVLRENPNGDVPTALGTKMYVDLRKDDDSGIDELIRSAHGMPRVVRPPIGRAPSLQRSSRANPEDWYSRQRAVTIEEFRSRASMELTFNLTESSISIDQDTLLSALRKSEVRTFGWPLGLISPRPESQPRVRANGIDAEIRFQGSYDYWALRNDGAFYVRQSLFEDKRDSESIFFNTRIVRVAEGMQLARNLYRELNVGQGSDVAIAIRHDGIRDRRLGSSNPARHMSPILRKINEDEISSSAHFEHPATDAVIVSTTKILLDPFFMLFDFFKPSDTVYEEIITSFLNGQVT